MINAEVQQVDLNLNVIKKLLNPDSLDALAYRVIETSSSDERRALRLKLLNYVAQHPNLWANACGKNLDESRDFQERAIKIVKRVLDLALEYSIFGLKTPDLRIASEFINSTNFDELIRTDVLFISLKAVLLEAVQSSVVEDLIVGISVPFFSQIVPALACSRLLRVFVPTATIIWGGPQVWLFFDRIRSLPGFERWVDGLCFGQGESTVIELAQLDRGTQFKYPKISNLWWSGIANLAPSFDDQIFSNINELPTPDFSDFNLDDYLVGERQYPLITCLGCYWGRCTFCSYGNRYYRAGVYQELSAERLAFHCAALIDIYGANKILFVDENNNLKLIIRACRLLAKRGYRFSFNTRNRLEKCLLNLDFCRELKHFGCNDMAVGYETNSQRLLDNLQRGVYATDFQLILDNLHQVGISVRLSVMGAILDETVDEMRSSFDFLKKNKHKVFIDTVQTLIVEPMTFLADEPELYGIAELQSLGTAWNRATNFGLGRVGYDYSVPRNSSRNNMSDEKSFARLYRQLPEPVGIQNKASQRCGQTHLPIQLARLRPSVVVLPRANGDALLCDLASQMFLRLAAGDIRMIDSDLQATSRSGEALLGRLTEVGFVVPVITRAGEQWE